MENNRIPFGKKLRAGNFYVLKLTKSISGRELKQWRTAKGVPEEIQRTLGRSGLPCIKVSSVSENWSIELACTHRMYMFIDSMPMEAGVFTNDAAASLENLFTMWYTDTCLLGDKGYIEDKGNALKAFMNRVKALEIGDEEDASILHEEQVRLKAEENLRDMEERVRKEAEDGSNRQAD